MPSTTPIFNIRRGRADVSGSISDQSMQAVGLDQPKESDTIEYLQVVMAMFITQCEELREEGQSPRDMSIAITEAEGALLRAVKGLKASNGLFALEPFIEDPDEGSFVPINPVTGQPLMVEDSDEDLNN